MRLKAIIFDVDGTLAETEETHRVAFNRAFAEGGLEWHWTQDEYRALLTTTGGKERIGRYLGECGHDPDAALIARLHARKNAFYAAFVADGAILPRAGMIRLIEEARHENIRLAIATTTSRMNVSALLSTAFPGQAQAFSVIVTGEDVDHKKPHPEVYQRALAELALGPAACVAIEDSRNGLDAALGAGLRTIITPSYYTIGERFTGADIVVECSVRSENLTLSRIIRAFEAH